MTLEDTYLKTHPQCRKCQACLVAPPSFTTSQCDKCPVFPKSYSKENMKVKDAQPSH